ncbi:M13 family peptidase [Pseudoduganella ginsengisoli]|uniref:M13 family peptidase n=1 Tax=Pseudoduganella ginsengisoli TaxID=1462440 RepID=A0A6L6Q8N2_9BURK|nr:M13 family metallopeptidase [Pseudoduganella ginsengisoli]MTW06147.1 M13 family peptidase [Pseudoduganella ginsengisoli]
MKRTLLSLMVFGCFHAYAAGPQAGIDTASIDHKVRAQDDFFRHTQGKWLSGVEIPADRSNWGSFNVAQEKVEEQVRTIIEQAERDKARKAGSDAQKIGDYYASFMDEKRRNALGLTPLKAERARIAALSDKQGIAALAAHMNRIDSEAPLDIGVGQDNKDSTRYIVYISQSGLGLPNRDYFLSDSDARLSGIRAQYQQHVEKMLALAGHAQAAEEAAQIVALETDIARAHWTAVERRDPVKAYNKLTLAQVKALMPNFDWDAYLKGVGVAGKTDTLIVRQPSYLAGLDKLIAATPLPVWKAYFEFHLLSAYAPYLSQAFVDESFAFRGTVLSGAKENRALPKRAIAEVNRALGEVVGKAYVKQYFPPERKQQVADMVQNFIAAFREGIETLDWMSKETKAEAQIKLSKINVKVGYPDKWRDYSHLAVKRDDLVGNVLRSREFSHEYSISKLGKPVDRSVWSMTPQTVNAYYSPTLNEVVFPAARLQYPLYDPDAEPAVNYGAVGISIGHEISHAFDDKGSQYDGDGNLRNWWTREDGEKFAARGKMLVAQYNGYSPVPGYFVNGELTLGENIADNAGLVMATRAYKIYTKGQPGPVIDGYTAEQRLFMGMAQARRGKARDAAAIAQVKSDPHSPSEFRVNGSVKNHPGFYDAFDVKEGDKMYLPPEQRVIFW